MKGKGHTYQIGLAVMEKGTANANPDGVLRRQVLAAISAVLPHVLEGELPDVGEDTRLLEELGMNSADTLEFILEIEAELNIAVDVEGIRLSDFASVGSLADYIASNALAMG